MIRPRGQFFGWPGPPLQIHSGFSNDEAFNDESLNEENFDKELNDSLLQQIASEDEELSEV